MKKLTVTYHAGQNNKVVEVGEHTFFDGKPEDIEVPDHIAEMLTKNTFFECSKPEDVDPNKPTKSKEPPPDRETHKGR